MYFVECPRFCLFVAIVEFLVFMFLGVLEFSGFLRYLGGWTGVFRVLECAWNYGVLFCRRG